MIGAPQLRFILLFSVWLFAVRVAEGVEPKSPAAKSTAERNARKIPTRIAGTYRHGELVAYRVEIASPS